MWHSLLFQLTYLFPICHLLHAGNVLRHLLHAQIQLLNQMPLRGFDSRSLSNLCWGLVRGNIFFMWLLYAHFSWTNSAPPVIEFLSSHHSDAHSCCCSISTNIAVSATMHFLGQAGGGWRHRWFLHGQSSDHGCTSFDRAPVGSDIQPGEVACLMLFQACN
jgi:hypothetical protein